MPEDLMKTGPVGLKGIRGASSSKEAEDRFMDLSFEESMKYLTPVMSKREANLGTAKELGQFTPLSTGADYGSSIFDKNIMDVDEAQRVSDIRAERQPSALKLGAGVVKMGSTAVTTYLDGTLGTIYGLGQGLYNALDDDPKTTFRNGLWNNDFNKWMAAAQEKMEEIAPNYYTSEQLDSAWYSAANLLSANFWGDKFLKNMGFTMGAMATMATPGFNLSWATKGLGAAGKIVSISLSLFLLNIL